MCFLHRNHWNQLFGGGIPYFQGSYCIKSNNYVIKNRINFIIGSRSVLIFSLFSDFRFLLFVIFFEFFIDLNSFVFIQ